MTEVPFILLSRRLRNLLFWPACRKSRASKRLNFSHTEVRASAAVQGLASFEGL